MKSIKILTLLVIFQAMQISLDAEMQIAVDSDQQATAQVSAINEPTLSAASTATQSDSEQPKVDYGMNKDVAHVSDQNQTSSYEDVVKSGQSPSPNFVSTEGTKDSESMENADDAQMAAMVTAAVAGAATVGGGALIAKKYFDKQKKKKIKEATTEIDTLKKEIAEEKDSTKKAALESKLKTAEDDLAKKKQNARSKLTPQEKVNKRKKKLAKLKAKKEKIDSKAIVNSTQQTKIDNKITKQTESNARATERALMQAANKAQLTAKIAKLKEGGLIKKIASKPAIAQAKISYQANQKSTTVARKATTAKTKVTTSLDKMAKLKPRFKPGK